MQETFTALLIDDDEMALNFLKCLLEETNTFSRILTTTEPQLAISICEEEKPDVLLLDIEMPNYIVFYQSLSKSS